MLESSQQIKISEFQIEQLRSTITRARLTEKELDGLPPETRTYEAVGRMYELDNYSVLILLKQNSINSTETSS